MVIQVLEKLTFYMQLGLMQKSFMAQSGLGMFPLRSLPMILLTQLEMIRPQFFKNATVI